MFKVLNGYEDVDRNVYFKLKVGRISRGHKPAVVKEQGRLDMRKYPFSQRIINDSNNLSDDCIIDSSVDMLNTYN